MKITTITKTIKVLSCDECPHTEEWAHWCLEADRLIDGDGADYFYEVVPNWCPLPDEIKEGV